MKSYSEARERANRLNAKKSTGPKTARGKARSSANSLKHGLTGAGTCLPTEDANEVLLQIDRLHAELCPITAEELFFVRRAGLLSVRVNRCYLKEASNLQMAVRDAIPNHDRKLFEEMRAVISQFPLDPYGSLYRLKQTAQGVDFMVAQWRDMRTSFQQSGNLDSIELERIEQLRGRRFDASGKSPFRELSQLIDTGIEIVDGKVRGSIEQVAACKARSRLELEALLSRQIEDLLFHRSTLPLADAERSRQEAPMRAVVDLSNAGQLLRRYENAAAREVTKIFAYFDQKRKDEALEILDASPELTMTPDESASFGNSVEPESASVEPEVKASPEPDREAVEPVENGPQGPTSHFNDVVSRPSRE